MDHNQVADFYISHKTRFSGMGVLSKYYHLLIDFCLPILYKSRNIKNINVCIQQGAFVTLPVAGGMSEQQISNVLKHVFDNRIKLLTLEEQPKHTQDIWLSEDDKKTYIMPEKYNYGVLFERSDDTRQRGLWSDYPSEYYDVFRNHIHGRVKPEEHSKQITFVQRQGPGSRGNDTRMIKLIKEKYEQSEDTVQIVDFSEMSFEQQVQTCYNTKVLIGRHGGGLTNSIFLQPGTKVVEFGKRQFPCYEIMSRRCGLEYDYIKQY